MCASGRSAAVETRAGGEYNTGVSASAERRIFSYAEARALIPRISALTAEAATAFEARRAAQRGAPRRAARDSAEIAMRRIVKDWQHAVRALGGCCAGLWMVRFDTGAGWYCWRHPEADLHWYYRYEDGFAGRERIH